MESRHPDDWSRMSYYEIHTKSGEVIYAETVYERTETDGFYYRPYGGGWMMFLPTWQAYYLRVGEPPLDTTPETSYTQRMSMEKTLGEDAFLLATHIASAASRHPALNVIPAVIYAADHQDRAETVMDLLEAIAGSAKASAMTLVPDSAGLFVKWTHTCEDGSTYEPSVRLY